MTAPVCLISGVGPGTGTALARRFAEGGYRVALLARSEERLAGLEKELRAPKDIDVTCRIRHRSRLRQLPWSATWAVPPSWSTTR
jgi:NADP-dependent 3-hydroxy acid dehydrogenase YdfG